MSSTKQPDWEFIDNLGDATPIKYGGYFVYRDLTGVYGFEAEFLQEPCEDEWWKMDRLEDEAREAAEEEGAPLLNDGLDDTMKIWTVYRVLLEPCTYINPDFPDSSVEDILDDSTHLLHGILSDNKFHPGQAVWFAQPEWKREERPQDTTYLKDIAESIGQPVEDLIRRFLSADPCERAWAWREVGQYHGCENLDSYPLHLSHKEVMARYKDELEELKNRRRGNHAKV